MSKADDVNDILGEGKAEKPAKAEKAAPAKAPKAPAKETKAEKAPKAPAKAEKPAKAPAKPAKAAPAKKAKAKTEKPAREPVVFEEGERDKLATRALKMVAGKGKEGMNSKDIAAKLGIETRKLRPVLYSLERAGSVKLKVAGAVTMGMTVVAK